MATSFVTGKPGGGKGLYTAAKTVEELLLTQRDIMGNFAWEKLPWVNGEFRPQMGLSAYMTLRHRGTHGCESRIWRLTDDACRDFYLYRAVSEVKAVELESLGLATRVVESDGVLVPSEWQVKRTKVLMRAKVTETSASKDGAKICAFDTTLIAAAGGCLIVLDEAWRHWGSRNWQNTGEGILYYLSQHRKTGDDLFICSQAVKDIDAALVRKSQDFLLCVNRGMLRMGRFKQPDNIKVEVYEHPPTGHMMRPMRTEVFKIDKQGLAQTYDTTAGVGLTGRMVGDMGKKRPGIPFKYLIAALCVFPFVMWFLLSKGLHAATKTGVDSVVHTSTNKTVGQNIAGYFSGPQNSRSFTNANQAETVTCTGYAYMGAYWLVYLSDGRILNSKRDDVSRISPDYVVVGVTNVINMHRPRFGTATNEAVYRAEMQRRQTGEPVLVYGDREPTRSELIIFGKRGGTMSSDVPNDEIRHNQSSFFRNY